MIGVGESLLSWSRSFVDVGKAESLEDLRDAVAVAAIAEIM
jgi:hypothetical protein